MELWPKRSKARKSAVALLIATGCFAFGCWANAQTECPPLFHQLAGSLNERFEKLQKKFGSLSWLTPEQKAPYNYEVYRMLQEAFYPLLRKYVHSVGSLTDQQISDSLKRLADARPIQKSTYTLDRASGIKYANFTGTPAFWFRLNVDVINRANPISFAKRNGSLKDQLLSSPNYLWVDLEESFPRDLGIATAIQEHLVTPVGEYGPEFSEKLIRTTEIMRDALMKNVELRKGSSELVSQADAFLGGTTARMQGHRTERAARDLAPVSSALEGVLSLHQLFATMLSKKVPGSATGSDALHDFIFNGEKKAGLVSEITTRLPMGTIGPMALTGFHFPGGMVRNAGGKLALSNEATELLRKMAGEAKDKSRCPMAGLWKKTDEKTGLQELAEAYWRVYKIVDRDFSQP